MSCPGCLPTGKALNNLYQSTKTKAADYGKEHKLSVAIYRTPEGYEFIEASIALSGGYQIKEIISYSEEG